MNETNNWLTNNPCTLTSTGTVKGYSATTTGYHQSILNTPLTGTSITTITDGSGLTLSGNSTINYLTNQNSNRMAPRQVHVAVFTIKRDKDTNEINSTKFVKELWIEQKNGTSIDLIVAKQLDKDFDPETTIIKVLSTLIF
jgi:hypothetical protein